MQFHLTLNLKERVWHDSIPNTKWEHLGNVKLLILMRVSICLLQPRYPRDLTVLIVSFLLFQGLLWFFHSLLLSSLRRIRTMLGLRTWPRVVTFYMLYLNFQSGKALFTTVRELVENGLDSAESIGEFPVIEVTIEEISRSCYNSTIDDDNEKLLDKSSLGIKVEEPIAAKFMKGGSFYRVTCKDNGRGIPRDAIPDIFGRVSIRKKYGMKQTRGKSGVGGAKMVSVWSKMSTGVPVEIYTGIKNQKYRTSCSLDVDIHRNKPIVHSLNLIKSEDGDDWHGASMITVVIKGNYGSEILEYMRQMAVITPYAEFKFEYIAADENGGVKKSYPRIIEKMPPIPVETKYHPSAVDSYFIIPSLIGQTSNQNLLQFLLHEFVKINKTQALKLIGKMGPGVTSKTQVNSLTFPQIARMHELFQQTQFDDPSGNCLSPLGESEFGLGIYKVLHPEVVTTYTAKRDQAYQGHPFIVEAGASVGGDELKQGLNIFRFANRVPLLFEQDADVVTTTSIRESSKWNRYKINEDRDKVGVFVNIVSTKIPFKGTGTEYIGDDISQIADAIKTCLEDCCKRLKKEIRRAEIESGLEFSRDETATFLLSWRRCLVKQKKKEMAIKGFLRIYFLNL
ncbi:hypothetical protein LXL04_025513 [Taraxacum kok-saghyz]